MLLLLVPSWRQPVLELFTCRDSEGKGLAHSHTARYWLLGSKPHLLSLPSLVHRGLGLCSGLLCVWPGKG